jgi:Putative Ig domain
MISYAYNLRMRKTFRRSCGGLVLAAIGLWAQAPKPEQLSILTKDLPPASLWSAYGAENRNGVRLRAEGGFGTYRWRVNGILPNGLKLEEFGELVGTPQESGQFQLRLEVRDSNTPPAVAQRNFVLTVETPFSIEWDRKAQVYGQRIDGSVKVSNRTGRDFDLTFVVLAVNEIGRATAIGYQHFPLKRNTRDLSLPFGDTLSAGNYTVNVDAVGEEPVSNRIFRARLVMPKQTIAQGP